jgi:uncharacterized protein
MKRLLLIGIFILLIGTCLAAIPNYKDKYVNDFAGVFSSGQVSELRGLLYYIDMNTTAEIVVVTDNECASKGGQSQYATEILSTWKVGKADKDNGLVVLYCKAENKIWASTGYGLEGILPDSKIGRMLDETYVPLRDAGNATEGILAFMESVAVVIEENRAEVLSGQANKANSAPDFWIYIIIFFWIYFIISKIIGRVYKKKGKNMPWFVPLFIPIRSGGSSGGFGAGGFGGGGFGGGMGGGGGAGR